jgi:hypothetical protein
MVREAAAMSLLALAACGQVAKDKPVSSEPPLDQTPPFESGDRLRARLLDGGQGAVAFVEWHDTELDTPCVFHTASDGVMRCLPWNDAASPHFSRFDVHYLDPSCSEAVVLFRNSAELPAYTVDLPAQAPGCDAFAEHIPVRRVGDRVQESLLTLYLSSYGNPCHPVVVDLIASDLDLYRLEEDVPPDLFLAAEREPDQGGQLSPIYLNGSDGSRQRSGVWDSVRESECWPLWGDGAPCVP